MPLVRRAACALWVLVAPCLLVCWLPAQLLAAESSSNGSDVVWPLVTLGVGILVVLGSIILLKVNAFIALITAAIIVSLMAPGAWSSKIQRVADAFGGTAGGIGIVIALAAVIGKCMLDSGAADRIVRAFVRLTGERHAPIALMGSGYVLAVPVFFDTVFYLLVPLARSLHRRTGKQYLKYILAISAGGALTHSLVPPTPGPLLMASTLYVDLGLMIMVGAAVALPAAFAGVLYAGIADRIMQTPMRSVGSEPEPEPLTDEQLPSLALSLAPVLLPVVMITINTVLTTVADLQPVSRVSVADVQDWPAVQSRLTSDTGVGTFLNGKLGEEARAALGDSPLTEQQQQLIVDDLNRLIDAREVVHSDEGFLGVRLSETSKSLLKGDRTRMRQAVRQRLNRSLLEDALRDGDAAWIAPQQWDTPRRQAADVASLLGNPNLALLLSTIIAMWMLAKQRGLTRTGIASVVETSLMSGGVIILITAGGGAFGKMLQEAQISDAIKSLFQGSGGEGGGMYFYLTLGFAIASVLKVAQGSGTVAMIVGSSMMAAIVQPQQLGCHPVYLATSIGAGSLVGSWMNDSGFWIFAKMGGLTEAEALKSWTLLLAFLGVVSYLVTLLLATLMPLT